MTDEPMTHEPMTDEPKTRTPRHEPAIRIRGLRKTYGYRRREALRAVDLSIPSGAVALLVGPNGAGKTTLLRVLMDLVPHQAGDVRVLGLTPRREGERIRAAVGFLPETGAFPFERLKVREILELQARFRPGWDAEYARTLSGALELEMGRPWKTLSKGEFRRVQLVGALAHRPPLLLLDEPTDGLDPVGRERVLGLLAEHLADTGATTLYCTHVLHEVQGLADHLAVLQAGRVRVDADAGTLRRTHRRIRFRAEGASAPAPFLLRGEKGSGPGEHQWIAQASESAIREWAAREAVSLLEIAPLSLEDIALAHLSAHDPRSAVSADGGGGRRTSPHSPSSGTDRMANHG